MTHPVHHRDALEMLELVAYHAALYTHLDTLLSSMCAELEIEQRVIDAVHARAKHNAYVELTKMVRYAHQIERLQPIPPGPHPRWPA